MRHLAAALLATMSLFPLTAGAMKKAAPPPAAAVWSVGHGVGNGCHKADGSYAGGAKACHNCLAAHGTYVQWKFVLLCNGKETDRVSQVSLDCTGPEGRLPEDGPHDQHAALVAKVNLPKAGTPCP